MKEYIIKDVTASVKSWLAQDHTNAQHGSGVCIALQQAVRACTGRSIIRGIAHVVKQRLPEAFSGDALYPLGTSKQLPAGVTLSDYGHYVGRNPATWLYCQTTRQDFWNPMHPYGALRLQLVEELRNCELDVYYNKQNILIVEFKA